MQNDPLCDLKPYTKLKIYDYVINGRFSLLQLQKEKTGLLPNELRTAVEMVKFYFLGFLTIQKALKVWDEEMEAYLPTISEYQYWYSFPHIIYNVTLNLLSGIKLENIHMTDEDRWPLVGDWHVKMGNTSDIRRFEPYNALEAVYTWYRSVRGILPYYLVYFKEEFDSEFREEELSSNDLNGITYYAFNSFSFRDLNQAGFNPNWSRSKLIFKRENALKFWKWWLFEAVPKARSVDVDSINWKSYLNKEQLNLIYISD